MRRITDDVAKLLEPHVDIQRTRPDAELVPYGKRLKAANKVDWMVSLHSDSRAGDFWGIHPQTGCYQSRGGLGFSVLWSDEGNPDLVTARANLARAIARRMASVGFLPYSGIDYPGLYDADPVPGVFVDRHAASKRIMLLRRPTVPSVIVETHQALDPGEAARWEEPATRAAFAGALGLALGDVGGVRE